MAKPSIIVNGGSPGVKAAVSASASWSATLDSTDGVRQVAWSVVSTDETTTAGSYTLTPSGSVGQNVAGTAQGQGTAILLKVIVNAGINQQTQQADPENTSATVKIYVPLADGGEVGCAGEEYESDPTFGATGIINQGIRKASALSPSGIPVKIVRAATAAALPSNTRTSNVLTASVNGAIGTVGGVTLASGDYVLVKDEGGGASHVNNGPFVLADGDGSNPWTLTRATYFDDSSELIAMTTFRIQEGTYAEKEFYLKTSGATINVTALEFAAFAYAPNDAAYLCVGSSGFLTNEVNVSAIGTTVEFVSTSTLPLAAKRTDSTTADFVDVAQATALSSGTAAAGFGPSIKFLGEVSGGGAENYGRVGFAATDLTGSSEDTKAVFQTRTAGAALATCAEFSGTAVKLTALGGSGSGVVAVDNNGVLSFSAGGSGADATAAYLTNASSTVNANDVPIQALPSQLEFIRTSGTPVKVTYKTGSTGTTTEALRLRQQVTSGGGVGAGSEAVKLVFTLPNGSGTETIAGSVRAVWQTVIGGGSSQIKWGVTLGGVHADAMTLTHTGVLDVPAGLTAASLDASSAGALTLGGTNATSIAASSLKITGLAAGTASGHAVEYDQLNTAVAAAVAAPLTLTLNDATANDVSTVLTLRHTTTDGGNGAAGIGSQLVFESEDAAGNVESSGRITGRLTTTTNGAEVSEVGLWTRTGGASPVKNAYLDGAGLWTTTGGVTSTTITASTGFVGPQINRATSGTFTLGSNITTVAGTAVAMTGIASVDNSGSTLTLGANTTSQTIGKAATTATFPGLIEVDNTAAAATSAYGIKLYNTATTGNRYSPGIWLAAFSGSTQKNVAIEHRALGTGRNQLNVLYGDGSSYPTSTAFQYDELDSVYFDNRFVISGIRVSSGSAGIKFNGGSAIFEDGSSNAEYRSAGTGSGLLNNTGKTTGGTGAAWSVRMTSGTHTAGYSMEWCNNTTRKAAVAYDGVFEGPKGRGNATAYTSDQNLTDHQSARFDCTSADRTGTLPTAAGKLGTRIRAYKVDGGANRLLLAPTGSEKIDGANAAYSTTTAYGCIEVESDNVDWMVAFKK